MDVLGPLPSGWECKVELKLNRIYFINHANKSTTWEDPRLASHPTPPYHVAITQPNAYFEETAGSRWSSPVPSIRAFSLHRRGSSPRLGGSPRIAPSPTPPPRNRRNEPVIHFEPSTPNQRRASASSILHHPGSHVHQQHHVQLLDKLDTATLERPPSSYSSSSYSGLPTSHLISCDTETAYRTVCNLFPTATEQHVKHLFHKYHNRANVVTSALQVEKYPLASDLGNSLDISMSPKNQGHGGSSTRDEDTDTILSLQDTKSIGINSPFKRNSYATNSPARTGTPISLLKFSNNQSSVGSLLTRSFGSPILSMSPQMQMVRENGGNGKLQKSPKMKLKYMKGIFPAADETILLDVLSSCENNVQKASEKLMRKGFARTPPPKPARQKWLEVKSMIEKRQRALDQQRIVNFHHEIRGEPQESPFPTPIMKTARPHPTAQEKASAREYLVESFPNLPERFLSWALEASSFSKEKAERLLREIGPQTPEELKPFITQGDQTDFAEIVDIIKELEVPVTLNNNVEKGRSLPKVKKSSSKEFRTVDSSIQTEHPPRKKNFLQTLFSLRKSDKAYITSNKNVKGPNSFYAKGADPGLLRSAYVQTHGPNVNFRKGADPNRACGPQGRAQGANPSLAKGSFWSRIRNNQVQFVAVGG